MSTKTKELRWEQVKDQTLHVVPVSCRMIRVEVYDQAKKYGEGPWDVSWQHVIGFVCARNLNYPEAIDAWPVLTGDCPEHGDLYVDNDFQGPANLKYKAVVPCFWPPEQDEENAIRIGKELVARGGQTGKMISLDVEAIREHTAAVIERGPS
jgi:hypothetical protein